MPNQTGTITAVSQNVAISGLRDTLIAVVVDGTYAGVEIVFEGSIDGSLWFPLNLSSAESGVGVAGTGLITNSTLAYGTVSPSRFVTDFRVRSTAYTSGTMNVDIQANKQLTEPSPLEELLHGQTNVTTAGTAVVLLSGAQVTYTLTISSKETNTGNIYIGDSSVDSSNGFILPPGGAISIDHNHSLDNIYIDSDNDGEGVSYIGSIIVV